MSLTKRQILDAAFAELGLSSEFYDLTPGQYQKAMMRMDLMISNWANNAIRIAYNMPSPPGSGDIDDDSGVPDVSLMAVILGAACQSAPSFGKQVSPETRQNFKDAYDNLVQNATADIPEMQMPKTLPLGAGTKPWRLAQNPFAYPPRTRVAGGAGDPIEQSPSDGNVPYTFTE